MSKSSPTVMPVDKQSQKPIDKHITLVVGNQRFRVNPDSFAAYPDTKLGKMFGPHRERDVRPDIRGEFQVAPGISANVFGVILEYYSNGFMLCPSTISVMELRNACDYFLIPFTNAIECDNMKSFLQELSNEARRSIFLNFLRELLIPVMIASADKGDRVCHIVVLMDGDADNVDIDCPPQSSEIRSQYVRSTTLCNFLKSIDNRSVAERVLHEKHLTKIQLGIDSYPSCKEDVECLPCGSTEAIYKFTQRPFLHISWEEDEGKTSHVGIKFVRSSKITTPKSV